MELSIGTTVLFKREEYQIKELCDNRIILTNGRFSVSCPNVAGFYEYSDRAWELTDFLNEITEQLTDEHSLCLNMNAVNEFFHTQWVNLMENQQDMNYCEIVFRLCEKFVQDVCVLIETVVLGVPVFYKG